MMQLSYNKKYLPLIIAGVAATIGLVYYIFSGQGSLDQETKVLQVNQEVEQVQIEQQDQGQKTVKVKCKNGSEYEVYYAPGSTDYEMLAKDHCND